MPHSKRRIPFRYLEPSIFGGLLDDPLLYLRIRPVGRALLFDCGQIAHLAKRVVKPIDTVFITHAHMDHIMGIPTLVRHHHASPRPMDIFGPPGIADRIHHQLRGYDWNLSEANWFTLRVHEVHEDRMLHVSFIGPEGFARRYDGEEPRNGREVWSCGYVAVEAELLDHKLPVLAFRIEERQPFTIDPRRLAQEGLVAGEWIRDLKRRIWKDRQDVRVMAMHREGEEFLSKVVEDPHSLYERIRGNAPSASIGYLCDVGWTGENRAKIGEFLEGVTLLCADCTFLKADAAKARASYHLCTEDLNELASSLAPTYLLPLHLSKSYLRRSRDLYAELRPPAGTTILPLPNHIIPAPLGVDDVACWLRPTHPE